MGSYFKKASACLIFAFVFISALAAATPTTTTLAISPSNYVTIGSSAVTLTATVNGSGGLGGMVHFCDADAPVCVQGDGLYGSAALTNSGVFYTFTDGYVGTANSQVILGYGVHNIRAVFLPTNMVSGSASLTSTLTVSPSQIYTSTTTLAASGLPTNYTLSGTTTAFGSQPLGGTVSFLDSSNGNALIGTASFNASTRQFTAPVVIGNGFRFLLGGFGGDGNVGVVISTPGGLGSVYAGNGDGTFALPYSIQCAYVGTCYFATDGTGMLQMGSDNSSLLDNRWPIENAVGGLVTGDFFKDGFGADVFIYGVGGDFGIDKRASNGAFVGDSVGVGSVPATVSAAADIEVADVNGDGNLDLVVPFPALGEVGVFLGNGNGTFKPIVYYAAGPSPESVAVADFNEDGKLDLAVANAAGVAVLLGNGDGTFQPPNTYARASPSTSIAVADMNNDGHEDIVVAGNTVAIMYGNGEGGFLPPVDLLLAGNSIDQVGVGDFNDDGIVDLVIRSNSTYPGVVSILLGEQVASYSQSGVVVPGTGSHDVFSSYGGDGSRLPSQSPSVTMTAPALLPQAIIFAALPSTVTYGVAPLSLSATGGGSGNPVAFNVLSGPGFVLGNSLYVTGVGTIVVAADQAGNASYSAAPEVAQSVIVNLATTALSVSCSPDPIFYGAGTTFCSPVQSAGTGTLAWTINGAAWTTTPVGSGAGGFNGYAAGIYIIGVTYSGDSNYGPASATTMVQISKAPRTASISCSPNPTAYGNSHTTCTSSVSGGNAAALAWNGNPWGTGSTAGFDGMPAGNYTITANATGDPNYMDASAATIYVINKVTPTITWPNPAAIIYGTPLSALQLDASSGGVAGTFVYSPLFGAVLPTGPQTLSVTFTPSDSADYNSPSPATVTLMVNRADRTVSISCSPNPTTFGNSNTVCTSNVSAGNAAAITYDGVAWGMGTVSGFAGWVASSHNIVATASGDPNYNDTSASTIYTILPSAQTISFSPLTTPVPYGIAPIALSASAASGLPVTFTVISGPGSIAGNTLTITGVGTVVVAADQAGDANHLAAPQVTQSVVVFNPIANTVSEVTSNLNPSTFNQSVTFSAMVDTGGTIPTGTVTFMDGATAIWTGSVSAVTATNLALYSQQIGNGSWTGYCGPLSNLTVNTTDITAPDGTQTATKLVVPNTSGCAGVGSQGAIIAIPGGLLAGQVYTASVWLRGTTAGQTVSVGVEDGYTQVFSITTTWQRYSVTLPPYSGTEPTRGFQFLSWDQNATFYVWGAQTEAAASAGPYVATTAASLTGSGGAASFSTSSLAGGSHPITTVYSGDALDTGSTAPVLTQVVNGSAVTASVSCSPSSIPFGSITSCSAHVSAGTGTVQFSGNSGTWTLPVDGNGNAVLTGFSNWTVGTYTVNAAYSGDSNYSPATGSGILTITPVTPSLSVSCSPNPITYGSQTTSCTASQTAGSGTLAWTINGGAWTTTGVNGSAGGFAGYAAGSYTIGVTYSGDSNYSSVSASTILAIDKATPVVTFSVVPNPVTYGTDVTVTVHVDCNTSCGQVDYRFDGSEWGTVNLDGGGNFSAARGPDTAGTHSIQVNYLGNANYNPVSPAAQTLTVNRADRTASISCSPNPTTYGNSHTTCTSIISAGNAAALTWNGNPWGTGSNSGFEGMPAASYNLVASATGDPNYNDATASTTYIINKATPTITWAALPSITYPTPFGIAQETATASVAGTFIYSPKAGDLWDPGAHTLSVTFTPTENADYTSVSATTSIYINPGMPTITWVPAPLTFVTPYGSPTLTAAQLNATCSVPGTLVYDKPIGTFFTAGLHTLQVECHPVSSLDYNIAHMSVTIDVAKANPVLNWATPSAIPYGTALSAAQLNATADVGGNFVYAPALGTVLGPGTHTLSVTFTDTDHTANYNTATATVTLIVNQATPAVSVSCSANPVTYGGTSTCTASVTPGATGTVTFSNPWGVWVTQPVTGNSAVATAWPAGSWDVNVTYSGDANYNVASASTILTILKATPAASLNCAPNPIPYGPQTSTCTTVLSGGATGTVSLTYNGTPWASPTLSGGTASATGFSGMPAGLYNVVATYGGDANNATVSVSTTLTIIPGPPLVTLACVPVGIILGSNTTCTATVPATDGTVAFYSTADLSGKWWNAAFPAGGGDLAATPDATTQDGSLNYNITGETWAAATAGPAGVNQTNIYARWTGKFVSPTTGTYTIGVNSDDGANVYVNGTLLVGNLSTGQGAGADLTYTRSGQIGLTAGTLNSIVVEYEQGQGQGGVQLLWTPPGASAASLLGWTVVPVNGSGQASVTGGSTWNAGAYNVTAIYSGDANYSAQQSNVAVVTVTPATPTVTVSCAPNSIAYGSTTLCTAHVSGGTGTVVFTAGSVQPGPWTVAVDGSGNAVLTTISSWAAGTYTITANYSGDSNYTASTGTGMLTITNSTPILTWANPAPITYGTPLSGLQLNATSGGVAGVMVYTPAAGTVLAAGTQTLSVTFTPTDGADYSSGTATVVLAVNKAPLTVTPNPASRLYGVANPAFAGSITGLVGGDTITATYASAATTTTVVGVYSSGVNAVAATLSDPGGKLGNYTLIRSTGTLTITQATTVLTWATPAAITYGTALSAPQLDATSGGVAGVFTYTPTTGTVLSAGSQTLSVTFVPTDTADYSSASATVVLVVNKAVPVVTLASSLNPSTYGDAVTFTANTSTTATGNISFYDGATAIGTGTLAGGTATVTTHILGAATHVITAGYAGDTNYSSAVSSAVSQVVQKAVANMAFTSSVNPSNFGQSVTFTMTMTGVSGMAVPTGSVAFSDGGTLISNLPMNASGVASYTSTSLTSGQHSLSAAYGGEANYQ